MATEHELSASAARCRDERLPGLLAAVRSRQLRRRVGRRRAQVAIVLAFALSLPATWWWRHRPMAIAEASPPVVVAHQQDSPPSIVRDDPTVLGRCAVRVVERDDWYLDDQGLQQLLQQAGLDSGLIRAAGRLLAVAAVDGLPTAP